MIIEVPLFIQTNQFNCGPTALKMVLAHFGEHFGIEVLEKRIGGSKNKGVNSIQIVAAAASLGYGVAFYSNSIAFNTKNNELDFYKKYNNLDNAQINIWIEKARASGAILNEMSVELNDLLSLVSEDSIPIILVDWNVINDREEDGYQGHFAPIVGYDHKYVYLHNGGYNDHKANFPVEREVFEKARKARGTDQDLIVIFRKGVEVKLISNKKESKDLEKKIEVKNKVSSDKIKDKKVLVGKTIKEDEKKFEESIKNNPGVSLKDVGIDKEKSLNVNKNIAKEVDLEKKEIIEMEKEVSEMKKKIDLMKNKIKKRDFGA